MFNVFLEMAHAHGDHIDRMEFEMALTLPDTRVIDLANQMAVFLVVKPNHDDIMGLGMRVLATNFLDGLFAVKGEMDNTLIKRLEEVFTSVKERLTMNVYGTEYDYSAVERYIAQFKTEREKRGLEPYVTFSSDIPF